MKRGSRFRRHQLRKSMFYEGWTTCSVANRYQRFEGTSCVHPQDKTLNLFLIFLSPVVVVVIVNKLVA